MIFSTLRQLRVLLSAMAFLCVASFAAAQNGYPNRPIKLIVPFAPGGTTDVLTRLVAGKMAEGLGQPLVVENKPGAGGNIGADFVAKAAPDGYTLLVGTPGPLAINASLYKRLSYDPARDFVPVGQFVTVQSVLAAHPGESYKDVRQLIAYAKANPGKVSYASSGIGASPHLAAELFKANAGISMQPIAYKGDAPALNDLLGGQVPLMFANIAGVLPHIKAGKIRPLAVAGPKRSTLLPDVPTIAESGMPGFSVTGYAGIVAPAATPPAIVARLSAALNQAVATSEIAQQILLNASEPVVATPSAFADLLRAEQMQWAKVIREANIVLE